MPTRRITNAAGFLICALLLAYAIGYLDMFKGLEPCPLCIFQRIGVLGVGLFFLLAAVHNPKGIGARVYASLVGFAALAGGAVSARHVWLQNLPPDRVPECGPGLEYMLEAFPLGDTLRMVFTGSGECADVTWTLLGLSMPAWVLIWFLVLGIAGVVRNWLPDSADRG